MGCEDASLLTGNEQVLGSEHPSTLTSVSNLGEEVRGQGKFKPPRCCTDAYLQAGESGGPEHPDTLTSSHAVKEMRKSHSK